MIFNYQKPKYKLNNNNQINNLLLITRNQLLDVIYYNNDFKIPINNNKIIIKKINRYKHIRNNYLNKYSYMSINLYSLFFIKNLN